MPRWRRPFGRRKWPGLDNWRSHRVASRLGVVLIVAGLTRKDAKGDDALQILRARLARGEITKEQFDELKEALK